MWRRRNSWLPRKLNLLCVSTFFVPGFFQSHHSHRRVHLPHTQVKSFAHVVALKKAGVWGWEMVHSSNLHPWTFHPLNLQSTQFHDVDFTVLLSMDREMPHFLNDRTMAPLLLEQPPPKPEQPTWWTTLVCQWQECCPVASRLSWTCWVARRPTAVLNGALNTTSNGCIIDVGRCKQSWCCSVQEMSGVFCALWTSITRSMFQDYVPGSSQFTVL